MTFAPLLHIMAAETGGRPMTSGDLSHTRGLSGSAITYLVDRLIDGGHIRRDNHPADRRKVVLRNDEYGLATARSFFSPLSSHTRIALGDLIDADLSAAHRVLRALIDALRRFGNELGGGRNLDRCNGLGRRHDAALCVVGGRDGRGRARLDRN